MHLTEKEVAFLMGLAHGSPISRYEHFHSHPSLQTLLRLIALFGCEIQELFAGEYQKAEELVLHNTKILRRRYEHQGKTDLATAHKIKVLSRRLDAIEMAQSIQPNSCICYF